MKLFGLEITKVEAKAPARRSFDAARRTPQTADWLATRGTADRHIAQNIQTLRDRARDMERNDGYAECILAECEANIIGRDGIQVKPMAYKQDARVAGGLSRNIDANLSEKISNAWLDYSKRGNFEVTRTFDRASFERMAVRSMARDGGFLIRMVDGFTGNPYRFAVQGIETDALDPKYNDPGANVWMSVQFDEWGAPTRYYLEKSQNNWRGSQSGFNRERIEVSAEDIAHLFVAKRSAQTQGYSWLAPVMMRLRHLTKFEEAEVIAARENAQLLGFYKRTEEPRYTGEEDEEGNIIAPQGPGEWEELPWGVEPHQLSPEHPNASYPDFRKAILRGVASGTPLSYNHLARDLEGVSFSSIRQGVLSEREAWKMLHGLFVSTVSEPVYKRWLRMALMTGQIEGASIADYERAKHAEFSGRSWSWVDPLKDIQAMKGEIEIGINSPQNIARERGRNFDATVAELAEDKAKLEGVGLGLTEKKEAPAPPNSENED